MINCSNCTKQDVCKFKDVAIEFEENVNKYVEIEDVAKVFDVSLVCRYKVWDLSVREF